MSKDMCDVVKDKTPAEARERVLTDRVPVTRKTVENKKSGLPPIKKASTLIGERLPLPAELVKGMLHAGSTMVYGGGSKTNKTFSLLDLAVSVASGTPWWGLETTQGRVLYLDFELQATFFSDRLDKIANAKGVPMEVLDNIDVWNLRGHAADISDILAEIIERIKDQTYALIIIDPIYKVLGGRDENSAGDINSLMNALDAIAVASRAAIVVGHHFAKGNAAGKESIDRISGSGVFARSPDAIVILTKHETDGVYTVETTLRNFKSLEPFCVEWNYPLMVRNTIVDPSQLKRSGAARVKFTTAQLLTALGNNELTTGEWQIRCTDTYNMSKRTFDMKKALLVEHLSVEMSPAKKWKIKPTVILDKPQEDKPVQSANAAIAPIAPIAQAAAA